jgi:RHS repeat-associated protein
VRHLDLNGRYSLTTYDLSGRVIELKPDGSESWAAPLPAGGDVPVTMTYNSAGQRASMNDASGETHYAYDDQSRLRIKQSPAGTLYYTYDDAGNITQISAQTTYTFASPTHSRFDASRLGAANARPEGAFMSYTYDGRNRLSQAYRDAAHSLLAAGYTYAAAGELQSIAYGNATTTTFEYNARKQLRRVRTDQAAGLLANFDYDEAGDAAVATVARATWGTQLLSATGRRNRLSENVRSITKITDFSYDNLNRLASESAGGSSVTYDAGPGYEASGYDEVGNRRSRAIAGAGFPGVDTQASLVYDKNDRDDNDANPDTPSTYFDGNGNRTSYDGWSYLYDFENHLITATKVGTVVSIIYDGDGNRVKKMVNGLTTAYLVDDRNPTGYSQVLEEQPDFGAVPETTYFYGLDLVSQTFRDSNGQTSTHYYGYDGQGTVRYLTSDTTPAAITDTYSYDAFGILIDEWTDGSTSENLYRYTGEQWDPGLGMYYLRARYFNPQTGRFWTMDPFEGNKSEPTSLHKYLYCSADPVNGTDRRGFWREIPSNFAGGKDAEAPVILDFVRQVGLPDAAVLTSVHGILDYASKTGYRGLGRLIPDLVNTKEHGIYDVKSWNETLDGMIKIQAYAVAFNDADPDAARATKWHAGLTYNYAGPNPAPLPGKSNGKDVVAGYFKTQGGVIPYKLYEVDDDEDRKRVPVDVPVPYTFSQRRTWEEYHVRPIPVGQLVYANYYAQNAARNVAIVGTAALLTYVGIATLNSMQGAP